MDEALIENWNATVPPNGVVYHLGDFSFRGATEAPRQVLSRLNGHIHLIEGNHDHKKVLKFPEWKSVSPLKIIRWQKQKIVLCHYAMRSWDGKHRKSWHLYGHSHGQLMDRGLATDVGVDAWDYKPVSFSRIRDLMQSRSTYHNEQSPVWTRVKRGQDGLPDQIPNQILHLYTVAESKAREADGELLNWIRPFVDRILEDAGSGKADLGDAIKWLAQMRETLSALDRAEDVRTVLYDALLCVQKASEEKG